MTSRTEASVTYGPLWRAGPDRKSVRSTMMSPSSGQGRGSVVDAFLIVQFSVLTLRSADASHGATTGKLV